MAKRTDELTGIQYDVPDHLPVPKPSVYPPPGTRTIPPTPGVGWVQEMTGMRLVDGKASNPKDSIGDTKVPLWLLSPIAKAHWALAQFAGMLKYGTWNWRSVGVRASVYLSAMQRHMDAYMSGEDLDPTDGSHHLGNVMACCAILLDAGAAKKLTDDRPPAVDVRASYGLVEAQMAVLKKKYADREPKHYTINDTEVS